MPAIGLHHGEPRARKLPHRGPVGAAQHRPYRCQRQVSCRISLRRASPVFVSWLANSTSVNSSNGPRVKCALVKACPPRVGPVSSRVAYDVFKVPHVLKSARCPACGRRAKSLGVCGLLQRPLLYVNQRRVVTPRVLGWVRR